jgi:hypothetical protein
MRAIRSRIAATSTLTVTVTRVFIFEPSGHAGAAQQGCESAPSKRISRRSRVHRPALCVHDRIEQPPCVISCGDLVACTGSRQPAHGHRASFSSTGQR